MIELDVDMMIGLVSILVAALYPILITHERRLSKLEGKIDTLITMLDGGGCDNKSKKG